LGVAGAAVPADVVVILGIVPVRLVPVKLNGPPTTPVVIFCTATRGIAGFTIFVKRHLIWALGFTLAAGIVSTEPLNVPKAVVGFPEAAALASVQLAVEIV